MPTRSSITRRLALVAVAAAFPFVPAAAAADNDAAGTADDTTIAAVGAATSFAETTTTSTPAASDTTTSTTSAATTTTAAAPTTSTTATAPATTSGPTTTQPPAPTISGSLSQDHPDPSIVSTGNGTLWAYSTQVWVVNVPARSSTDGGVTWTDAVEALPALPSWAESGHTWAPGVFEARPGNWVLWFTARHTSAGRQCIGTATATNPAGPFTPTSDTTPAICQLDVGGSIDAYPYTDPATGTHHIAWKSDANAIGADAELFTATLDPAGTTITSNPTVLLRRDANWEQPLIENPAMIPAGDGTWLLFYSANWWESANYATGYAHCATATGPCTKATTTGPWHQANNGPGGASFTTMPDGQTVMAHHEWTGPTSYANGGNRTLRLRTVNITSNTPTLIN